MTPIIIACVIVAAGAIVEGLAYIFTAKMFRKREEGLDRRQDEIMLREGRLDSREIQLGRLKVDLDERCADVVKREIAIGDYFGVLAAIDREKPKIPHRIFIKKTVSFDDVFHESIGGENVQRSLENHVALLKGLLWDVLYDHITVKQFNPPGSDDVELTAELWILEEDK